MKNLKLILIAAGVIVLLAIILFVYTVIRYSNSNTVDSQLTHLVETPPIELPHQAETPAENSQNDQADLKTYPISKYNISLEYPSNFGELTVVENPEGSHFDGNGCKGKGYSIWGKFSNSDIALVGHSDDYAFCGGRGAGVGDYVRIVLRPQNKVDLYSWVKEDTEPMTTEALIAQIKTKSPAVTGYIYNDTSWGKEENPLPVGIIPNLTESPLQALTIIPGATSNAMSDEDKANNINTLKEIISTFKYHQ